MRKNIITIAIIVTIILGLISVSFFVGMAPNFDNDPYATGNTAGNLLNNGLFCEYEGTVYFANALDGGALYSMNVDETGYKKLLNSGVKSINADKNRIYYALSGSSTGKGLGYIRKATGMYSMTKIGGKSLAYTTNPIGILAISGNNILYQNYTKESGTDLWQITTDKKDNHMIAKDMISPASIDSGFIIYSDTNTDQYLYRMDIASGQASLLYEHPVYSPIYQGGYIYYIDLATNYHLHRYSPANEEDIELTDKRVDMFNVYGNMIYYQTDSSSPDAALMRMQTDGTNVEVVSPGIYCDINITSQYVYFHAFNEPVPVYHQTLHGPVNPTIFQPDIKK